MIEKSLYNVDEKQCNGCGACVQICPKNCISFIENERGFLVSKIDKTKCINCGLCRKVCSEIFSNKKNKVLKCFAAVNKDASMQLKSTSGGLFGLFANWILENGGIVYGAAWDNQVVVHKRIENKIKLIELMQSKYVQSNTTKNNTFIELKKDLNSGRMVLFSGTGCQISGVKNFLGKDYENLYTIEVFCHGVPSPGLFRKYIFWLEQKNNKKVLEYSFRNRDKHSCGEHFKLRVKFIDGSKKYYYFEDDPYYGSFLRGNTLRKTCYTCKFKGEERVADISLGDFWGIEKVLTNFNNEFGCSAVLINNNKGIKFFDNIKKQTINAEVTFYDVIKYNESIISSTKTPTLDILNYDINSKYDELFTKIKPKLKIKKRFISFAKKNIPYKLKLILKKRIK